MYKNERPLFSLTIAEFTELNRKIIEEHSEKINGAQQSNSHSSTEKEILTIEDVCEITGYRKQTIYGKISSGTIPVIPKKPGQKFVRFRRSEILEWFTNSKQ